MKIKIVNSMMLPFSFEPTTAGSAGIDLRAAVAHAYTLLPGYSPITMGTGIAVAIPVGYVGLITPRSGLGSRGLRLSNTVGVIDSDYRGEIMLKVEYVGEDNLVIAPTDRIAQMVVVPHYDYSQIQVVEELDSTVRGANGFGSTGV